MTVVRGGSRNFKRGIFACMILILHKTQLYYCTYIRTWQDFDLEGGIEEFVERSRSLHETGMWEENGATEA